MYEVYNCPIGFLFLSRDKQTNSFLCKLGTLNVFVAIRFKQLFDAISLSFLIFLTRLEIVCHRHRHPLSFNNSKSNNEASNKCLS